MQVKQTNYQVNATPRFQVLTEDQVEAIYHAALQVLYETGVRVYDSEGVEIVQSGGAIVESADDQSHIVKIPHYMIDKARATTPRQVVIAGPDRQYKMSLFKNQVYFGGGADTSHMIDPETGNRRRVTYQDIKNFARLGQTLPNYDFHMSSGTAEDIPADSYDRWQYLAMLEGTSKPVNITAIDVEGVRDQLEMAYIRLGGKAEWKKGPIFSLYVEPTSPLSHSKEAIQKVLFACDNDIPFIYTPCPMAGATAPATLAGVLVQALADSLFGVVLSQLRKAGSQIVIGGLMSNMDMLRQTACCGSPEMALLGAGYTDIVKWLQIPRYGTAGCSDAKLFDEQAAIEAAISIATSSLVGGNMIHDVGNLNSGQTRSMDLMVDSDEIIGMVKRIMRGISVTDESMALNVMSDVGPGGHYLEHDHTYTRFKTEIWRPKLIDRQNWQNWEMAGGKRYGERANDRVHEILASESESRFVFGIL
jgi:trimethylamine--corrinoid protein Co-methyltransferase